MSLHVKASFLPYRPTLVQMDPGVEYDPQTAAAALLNFSPTRSGTTKTRGGYRAWKTDESIAVSSSATRPVACWAGKLAGPGEFLLFASDDKAPAGGTTQAIRIHGTHFRESSTAVFGGTYGEVPDVAIAGNRVYITRPGDRPISWRDVAGFAVEATMPSARFVVSYKDRLILIGLRDSPNSIAWSAAGRPTDFSGEGSGYAAIGSGQEGGLTGAKVFLDELVLTTADSIYRFSFTDDAIGFIARQMSSVVGCVAHRSIAQVGNDLYFLSSSGVHSLRQTEAYGDLEKSLVSPELVGLFGRLNASDLAESSAVYNPAEQKYLISVRVPVAVASALGSKLPDWSPSPGDSSGYSVLLEQEVQSGRWSVHDLPVGPMTLMDSKRGPFLGPMVVAGMAHSDGVTFGRIGTGDAFDMLENVHARESDHSRYVSGRRSIRSVVRTMPINVGEARQKKDWRRVDLFFRSGAAAQGKLRYVLDQKFDVSTAGRRDMKEKDFYLSPSGAKTWLGTASPAWSLGDGSVLYDEEMEAEKVSIDLEGHGRQIVLEIEIDSRPFELLGFELYFMPMASDIYEEVASADQISIPPN